MNPPIRIATRGSPLALWQAEFVRRELETTHPGLEVQLVRFQTKGDKILDVPLARIGGKGLFVKELEDALLRGEADLAVHSMKDVPALLPPGLAMGAVMEREDPRDALVSSYAHSLEKLRIGARVGTSSLRRRAQLLAQRPDLELVTLRGNVDTRLRRMDPLYLDGVVLACAGLVRMGFGHRITWIFPGDRMLPAIGQGALGLEIREDDARMRELIRPLNHEPTETEVRAERAFLRTLEGGCQVPIAARARREEDTLSLTGLIAELDGSRVLKKTMSAPQGEAEPLGVRLAQALLGMGGREILERVYATVHPGTGREA